MSRKTKAIIAAVTVLTLLVGALVSTLVVGMVVSMSLQQAQRHQQQATPCSPGGMQMVAATNGPVVMPIIGQFKFTSPYGIRIHPTLGTTKMHWGVDLATIPQYGPIVAVKDGVISERASSDVAGNWVRIDHGAGLTTRYLHMSKVLVSVGQKVRVGDQIGVEGSTGRSSGPHLHFEVKQGGQIMDPKTWLTSQGLILPPLRGVGDAARLNAAVTRPTGGQPGSASAPPGNTQVKPVVARSTPTASSGAGSMPQEIAGYRGEQLRNAATIIKAGQDLGADSHTLALGVMTAIGESTLIVVDHGDKAGPDSRGLFQQRANGAWGSYADRMNPYISAQNFYKALMAVPGYRELPPTIAAHRTQHNDDENHYARFWPAAVQIVAQITDNPDLLNSITVDGASIPCNTDSGGSPVGVGPLPGAPGQICAATGHPAEAGLPAPTLRLMRCGASAFPKLTDFQGFGERSGHSDHPAGYAVDFMIADYRSPAGRASGWQVAQWMRAHAKELGIKYVIWDMKTWSVDQDQAGWRPYTRYGPNPDDNKGHRNHVHVSLQH